MEDVDVKMFNIPNEKALHKSAIIYRDDSARFIYVCFHCGRLFNEINETLHHIETHFQLEMVEPFAEDNKGMHFLDNFGITNDAEPSVDAIDIKFEKPDSDDLPATSFLVPIIDESLYDCKPPEMKSAVERKSKSVKRPKRNSTTRPVNAKEDESDSIALPYRCHKCSTSTRNIAMLRSHLAKHTVKELLQVYKCKECDEYFRNSTSLRAHVLGVHLKKRKLKCPVCDVQFKFAESKEFAEHLQRHNRSDGKILAGISSRNADYSKYEEIDVFTEEPHSCEHCSLKFYIKSNLEMHLQRKHPNPHRIHCSECGANFGMLKFYYAHRLEHQRVGPTITETDENVLLANLEVLVKERMVVSVGSNGEPEMFRCSACDVTSDAEHIVRTHIRRSHVYKLFPPPLKPTKEYICDYCGNMLKTKGALRQHFMIHSGTKSHACSFCGKEFRLRLDKVVHERTHTGERPYQCDECGMAFTAKGHLIAHKRRHDDTTYPCEICGKTFNLPSGYRNHIKTHRQDRPFVCGVCGKSFNTKLYLRRHEVIHDQTKMYPCKFCDREFNTGASRRQHHRHMHKFESNLLT